MVKPVQDTIITNMKYLIVFALVAVCSAAISTESSDTISPSRFFVENEDINEKTVDRNDAISSPPEEERTDSLNGPHHTYDSQATELLTRIIHPDLKIPQSGPITYEVIQTAIQKLLANPADSSMKQNTPEKQSMVDTFILPIHKLQRQQILQQLQFLQKEQLLQKEQKMQQQEFIEKHELLQKQLAVQRQQLQMQQLQEAQTLAQENEEMKQQQQLQLKKTFAEQEQMLEKHQLEWQHLREQMQLKQSPAFVMEAIQQAEHDNLSNRQQHWTEVKHTSTLPPWQQPNLKMVR